QIQGIQLRATEVGVGDVVKPFVAAYFKTATGHGPEVEKVAGVAGSWLGRLALIDDAGRHYGAHDGKSPLQRRHEDDRANITSIDAEMKKFDAVIELKEGGTKPDGSKRLSWFEWVEEEIHDELLRQACVNFAKTLGLMILTGGVAAVAVRGLTMLRSARAI